MRCQLAKPYGLAPKFTCRRGLHTGRQSLMTLCYPRVTFLDASDRRKFYCSKIVAPAMAGVAGAFPPAMGYIGNLEGYALNDTRVTEECLE